MDIFYEFIIFLGFKRTIVGNGFPLVLYYLQIVGKLFLWKLAILIINPSKQRSPSKKSISGGDCHEIVYSFFIANVICKSLINDNLDRGKKCVLKNQRVTVIQAAETPKICYESAHRSMVYHCGMRPNSLIYLFETI